MYNQNIIVIAQQNWDTTIGTNSRNMTREFAKTNQVLFINPPLDVSTVLRTYRAPEVKKRIRVLLGRDKGLVQVEPNVWVLTTGVLLLSINWLASRQLLGVFNRVNAWWLARSIRRATRTIGFDSFYFLQDGLIFPGLELKRLLKPRQFLYNIRDYVLAVPYFRRHGPWLEAALMQEADVVTANSFYLRDYARQHNSHSYDIGQGCVLAQYQAEATYAQPTDLAAVPRPIIGYTGYLTALRLDLDLLLALAQERPEWSLVLVGPADEAFLNSALPTLPNVFFLGTKTPNELAAYLHDFDVCINPQIVNDITIGNYPLKIDEYLAMGKPVVATATPAMAMFADHVALVTGPAPWLQALETALADHSPQRRATRIAFAKGHTWAACVGLLYQALTDAEAVPHPTQNSTPTAWRVPAPTA